MNRSRKYSFDDKSHAKRRPLLDALALIVGRFGPKGCWVCVLQCLAWRIPRRPLLPNQSKASWNGGDVSSEKWEAPKIYGHLPRLTKHHHHHSLLYFSSKTAWHYIHTLPPLSHRPKNLRHLLYLRRSHHCAFPHPLLILRLASLSSLQTSIPNSTPDLLCNRRHTTFKVEEASMLPGTSDLCLLRAPESMTER